MKKIIILIITGTILFMFPSHTINLVGLICIAIGIGLLILLNKKPIPQNDTTPEDNTPSSKNNLPIKGMYQRNWMFTYHEKDAYKKLKPIAEDLGYTVFAKVRLLDLLVPKNGIPKYKTYFYKIQAKHVDFVLCDQKLVARFIIELDDSSHDTKDRQARDRFVDSILTDVGYKIIHTREITADIKQQLK